MTELRGATGCVTAMLLLGCSSSYRPPNSPRIAYTISGGAPALYKNGKEYPLGLFYGGVGDAVEGNPRAEAEARTANHLMIGGWAAYVGGLASSVAGISMGAIDPHRHDTRSEVGSYLLVGGLVTFVASVVLIFNAAPHAYDAVNIYNDGVAATWHAYDAPRIGSWPGAVPIAPLPLGTGAGSPVPAMPTPAVAPSPAPVPSAPRTPATSAPQAPATPPAASGAVLGVVSPR